MKQICTLIMVLLLVGCAQEPPGAAHDALLSDIARTYPRAGFQPVSNSFALATAALERLHEVGVTARLVALFAREDFENCFERHYVMEIQHPRYSDWIVVDFAMHRLYPQTLEQFISGRAAYVPLTEEAALDEPFRYACIDANVQLTMSAESWYDQLSGVSLIEGGDGQFYAPADNPLVSRVIAAGHPAVEDWHVRFYEEESHATNP